MEGLRRGAGLLVGLAALLCIPLDAGGQSIAHVHDSRVSVRSEASPTAPIAGFLTTNTIVEILARGSEWCRIRSSSTASLSGFVACRSLGDAPLTLDFVRTKLLLHGFPESERLDWLKRRFWLEPSLQQLQDVGEEMTSTMLSTEHTDREDLEGRVRRPLNPEFNAMKARLSAGVVPAAADHPQATDPRYGYPEAVQKVLKESPSLALQPSFFRRDEPLFVVALRPLTLTEQGGLAIALADALSAINKTPLRARTFKPAGYSRIGPIGTWDISNIGVQFDNAVTLHGITARGEPTGLAISSMAVPLRIQLCMDDVMSFSAKPLNARWNSAIVGWVGKAASVPASVTTKTIGETTKDRVTRQEIDLNGDTIADFLVLTGIERSEPDGTLYWKAVFANVDGLWILVADAESKECT